MVMRPSPVTRPGERCREELLAGSARERRLRLASPVSSATGMGHGALWLTGLAAFVGLVQIAAPPVALLLSHAARGWRRLKHGPWSV